MLLSIVINSSCTFWYLLYKSKFEGKQFNCTNAMNMVKVFITLVKCLSKGYMENSMLDFSIFKVININCHVKKNSEVVHVY